ncbi:MAG: dTMP kinase [Methanobacteriaceae archaeon]
MYICLEGIDGGGKSTQTNLLANWLEECGHIVHKIVEPTDNDVGILIRKLLTNPNATEDNFQKTLALLFAADRMMLMEEINKLESDNSAKNNLNNIRDDIFISDRSFYSSLAYQEPLNWIYELNKYIKKPNIVLLIDISINKAISRCDGKDEFEKEQFLEKVRNNYLELAKSNDTFRIINGNNGINKVHNDIKKAVAPLLDICVNGI